MQSSKVSQSRSGNKKRPASWRHSLLEERFVVFHVIGDSMEQPLKHREVWPKQVRRVGSTSHKVVGHDKIMDDYYIPVKCQTTYLHAPSSLRLSLSTKK